MEREIHLHSTPEKNDSWAGTPQGSQPAWGSNSGFMVENVDLASSSGEEAFQAAEVFTFATGHPTLSTYGSHGPGTSWNVESEDRTNYCWSAHSPELHFNRRQDQVAAFETEGKKEFNSRDNASVEEVRKKTFKLLQVENDNQDLSFVEKVILSREEFFGLSNNIAAGSAKSSEGRSVINFGSLDCKSMKVVGFFGSKDVMRGIFKNTKFREQRDIWMQTQDDTLAPGLYAWVEGDFVFVFYWHQGHALPEAARKDRSCNFIRYVFDLCDTVCICVEGKNVRNSLFESAPRFSKRQRTQRLQISLVKASEDSVQVTDGFWLKNLSLGSANALRVKTRSQKNLPLYVASGHEYKVSEGVSRFALLHSSIRSKALSSVKVKEKLNVIDFPNFIKEWTVDRGYSLDLKSLSDSDFLVFIRSAKLKEADEFDTLVVSNTKREAEESRKTYEVDELVEKEQQHLSRCLTAFIDSFLKTKYPLEENLMLLNSGAHLPMVAEASSKADGKNDQQSEILSTTLSQIQSDLNPLLTGGAREAQQDRMSQLEDDLYDVLLGKNSEQRMVFPNSIVYILSPWNESMNICGQRGPFVFTRNENNNKFDPICFGQKLAIRSMTNVSVELMTGTVQRCNAPKNEGLLFTHVEFVFIVDGFGKNQPRMRVEPVHQTGDMSGWLNQLAENTKSPCGWKHAALLSAVARKLSEIGRDGELSLELASQSFVSENPLDSLRAILTAEPVLEFARRKWESLRNFPAQCSAEMQQTAIEEPFKGLYVRLYEEFRSNLQSRINSQIGRLSTSFLIEKVRKQCRENCKRLEATFRKQEANFLASKREFLSRKQEGTSSLTLAFETCKLSETSGSFSHRVITRLIEGPGQKLSISLTRQEFERERISWHGLELAPMKEDLDQLVVDNEYAFTPSFSTSQEFIDLDPSSQTLLKVVFLKAGQLLVFVVEGHLNPKDLLIYLCPKLGVKVSQANLIHTFRRGFDLIAYEERSRFIALYDDSLFKIKIFRFDETFRHLDWTGVEISLGEYSIGRLIWMDFVIGKTEIVFIDDLDRVRLCDANQPGMVRSGNVHVGKAPILKAFVTTQVSCLLLLRSVRNAKARDQGNNPGVREREVDNGSDSRHDGEFDGLDAKTNLDSVHPAADGTNMKDGFPEAMEVEEQSSLVLDVYKLEESSIQYFSSIPLDTEMTNLSKLVFGLVSFSSQMHLVIFDSDVPSEIYSKVVKISSASEVCQLQQVTVLPEEETHTVKNPGGLIGSGPVLDYIYQVFEKYSTSPPLCKQSRQLHLRVVLKGSDSSLSPSHSTCLEYISSSLNKLRRDKGKDFSSLEIHISIHDADRFQGSIDLPWSIVGAHQGANSPASIEVRMGTWMRRLVCLVPIQIARAEHNALKPMIDGLQLSCNVDYVDAISLANVMEFGLYEAIFQSWTGPVKIISSMGKQSSGKSYLLNHLSGSLLDVAGGRCTDGVWMSLREGHDCLYVLLDFEGLGSFERSEQEDMLLSMLNAAISNLTIFNKKDFHLDKETEAIFERFQNGVSLVKTDGKLFKGLFYMAIKDVDISDVEDLKKEFFSKISQICSKSQDNFLTKMYGGSIEISAMPSFNRPEFHGSISDIAQTVEELDASYLSGRSFLLDLKLVIAQISTKDWSPIDSKRVALRVNLLRRHLQSAVSVGCFFSDGISKSLIQFDNHAEISVEPHVAVGKFDFPICDTTLELTSFQETKVTSDILLKLLSYFTSIVPRKGEKDEEWHSFFERFLSAVVLRRKERVLQWIALNTSDFLKDGDVQKLHLEAVVLMSEVQQNLLLCSCKCERCFLRCVQEKGHPSTHSCMGDHRCAATCTYCLEEESTLGAGPCGDVAGHDGAHDCHEKSHTCGKCCTYAATSSNCNGNCSKKSGHAGDHQCNARQHTCNQLCSLPSCKNPCVSPIDLGDHQIHACHEKFCPIRCTLKGCNRTCATEDHFHGIKTAVTHHFCGSEHPCPAKCDHKGNCEVLTEVNKKTQTFTGRRATFEYLLVSEQNGNRKGCCIVIPPFKDRHEGLHSHSSNPDAVHFCETRCLSCGYFCNRPIEHGGLHATTHGNMRDVNFVAESEQIDILDRKYAWGESGVAEMCQMHCKAQGRGHTHLISCPANKGSGTCRKLFDGGRHEIRKYGPDFDAPKDEMTHAAFWQYMRFEDPCSAAEKKQFALCNHQCKSNEHNHASSSAISNISYCTETLWHQPIPKTKFGSGYITDDGHHFSCDHSTNEAVHVIFIIDRSTSMNSGDIKPSMRKISVSHKNRLGCVYEAIYRFIQTRRCSVQQDIASVILFNEVASTVVGLQEMKKSLVDELLKHRAKGWTDYSVGLKMAESVLLQARKDSRLRCKSPVIIFLSDGRNSKGDEDLLSQIGSLKALDPKLQLHTIMFGKKLPGKILEDMAKAGDGTYTVSLNEVQLSRGFEGLAKSLRPQVASLL